MNFTPEEQKLIDRVNRWLKDSPHSHCNPFSRHHDPIKVAELFEKHRIIHRHRGFLKVVKPVMADADDIFAGL